MIRDLLYYINADTREEYAVIYHILLNTTKSENEELPYEDFTWIINEVNYVHAKNYFSDVISYTFLAYIDDIELCQRNFNTNWKADYQLDNNNKISFVNGKPVILREYENFDYTYYLSKAQLKSLNSVLRRWKLYKRHIIKLQICFSKILNLLKRILKNEKSN